MFAGTNSTERREIAALAAAKRIRGIGPRLYTSLRATEVPQATRAAWSTLVSRLFPGALLSHRTALEFAPSPIGEIIITGTTNRVVAYPGLSFRFVRGPGALDDDPKFMAVQHSSLSRALLENLAPLHKSSRQRVWTAEQIEARLEQILHVDGESAALALRDRARVIAKHLDWSRAFDALDQMIGLLLGTRTGKAASAIGRARAIGEPFDPRCLQRLQLLFAELRTRSLPTLVDPTTSVDHFIHKAFFESYFSNYIEGTTFELEEAESIVFDGKVPARRPIDAHDIIGTSRIVSDDREMRRTPETFEQFLELLRSRHSTMLAQRPEARPGELKDLTNRAGNTTFVAPEYVLGTLRQGFDLYRELGVGLPRAIFMMFLVADVHPFTDGNGRIARIMMNAELHAAGQTTIIIPTAYREEYVDALRALTRRERAKPVVDALVKAQAFSRLDFNDLPSIRRDLEARHWFREAEGQSLALEIDVRSRKPI